MAFFNWSRTASSNANADATINWAEGQLPSSVNDSARAMMARTAEWRDDISGALTTSGTLTAYTVSSNQNFDTLAHMDKAMIAFVPHTTNGAAPTLSVDGLTAKKIRMQTGIDIPDGVLIEGTPYVVTYYATAGEFLLHGLAAQPYSVPLGGLLPSTVSTPPNSAFVLPYGQAISRTTYASYFGKVGTTYGSGDGSTTFNVVDMRGRGWAFLDNMGGVAAGRLTTADGGIDGTTIGASGGGAAITIQRSDLPNVQPTFTGTAGAVSVSSSQGFARWFSSATTTSGGNGIDVVFSGNTTVNSSGSFTPQGTVQSLNGGVTQTKISNMPPTVVIPCFLRII